MEGLAARKTALTILDDVLLKKRALDLTLETTAAEVMSTLDPRDRSFARALVSITLRHLGELDQILSAFLTKPLPRKARSAHNILRIGLAQIIYFKVPDHAAVDSAVSLAKINQATRPFAKLVNGVLRNALRSEAKAREEQPLLNVPEWLRTRWLKNFGAEITDAIALAHMQEPPLDLTVKEGADTWGHALGATKLPTGSLRLTESGDVRELAGFDEGAWWVQDAAATLPAKLLGDVSGKDVLDLCAAPGGKTAQLAAAGANVTAVDRSDKRMARVAQNLKRLNLEAKLVTTDAITFDPDQKFEFILVDAPCSATGTIRRHPDLPWLKSERDVTDLADLQSRLLSAAAKMLTSGGTLVYCTCSLEPEEGRDQISAFLKNHSDFRRLEIKAQEVGGQSAFISGEGDLQTLPCHWQEQGGIDGFFAARLVSES